MRVFATGAIGCIGVVIVLASIDAGHQRLGLARPASAVASLLRSAADVHQGAQQR